MDFDAQTPQHALSPEHHGAVIFEVLTLRRVERPHIEWEMETNRVHIPDAKVRRCDHDGSPVHGHGPMQKPQWPEDGLSQATSRSLLVASSKEIHYCKLSPVW